MWTKYSVQFDFLTKLCASVPADQDLVKNWLEARKPKTKGPDNKSIDEMAQEVIESLPVIDEPERGLHVFQRHEGALVLRAATFRAHWKDCSRVMSRLWIGKVEGEKSFSVKVINAVYHDPAVYWLPILSQETNKPITDPTGQYDKPIHAVTPRGVISALKTLEFIENARVIVPVLVLTPASGKPVVSMADLQSLFEYGGVHGYGGERSDGEGRYLVRITPMRNPADKV